MPITNNFLRRFNSERRLQFSLKRLFVVMSLLCVCLAVAMQVFQAINRKLIRGHQQQVTRELEAWGETYSSIENPQEVREASEMLQYIESFYVPAIGYKSDDRTEKALELQRKQTIKIIIDALEKYRRVQKARSAKSCE